MSKRTYVIALVALVAVAGIYAAAKYDATVATAQILVIRKTPDDGKALQEDYMTTQTWILRSLEIATRATKTKYLREIPSFQGQEGAYKILESLSVQRDGQTNAVTLSASGVSKDEGIAILQAVIAAYQDFLDEKYKSQSDTLRSQIELAKEKLAQDVENAHRALAEHRVNFEVPAIEFTAINKEYEKQSEEFVRAKSRKDTLRARIEYADSCRKDPKMKDALRDQVAEWATKAGIPKEEATEERYINMLRFELGESEAIETAVKEKLYTTKSAIRKMDAYELKEESLKRNLAMAEQLFSAVTQKVQQIDMSKGGGFEATVIVRPRAK